MSMSNRERVAKGMEQLRAGLIPFAEREFRERLGATWFEQLSERFELKKAKDGTVHWDTHALLKAISDTWMSVFKPVLGHAERAYVGELREVRNRWAHEEPLTSEDAERALDTMKRMLDAISAGAQAEEILKLRSDLTRAVYAEQARNKTRYQLTLEGMPKAGLKPWREVVTPHKDVISGQYVQAEFAADLAMVSRNEGSDEYREPAEFYRRTFLTDGIRDLLLGALQRLTGKGGDPVVELQTNFGGGKTHSMLALYHLFGGARAGELQGIEPLLREVGLKAAPKANRAVLVGTDLSPAQPHTKPDGTVVRTLWGELAWQLGKAEGYQMVADSDARGVSPGGKLLGDLFRKYSPCLVLIDEWVAYARQIVGKNDMPGGNFAAQTTFAQALTEAAKAADKTLVVASIPASKIEIGGDNGEHALETLKNVFERVAKPWRPASGDEGFEIVRRRLFEQITDKDAFTHRDAVIAGFARMYKDAPNEYPLGCAEEGYRRELEGAYPIHPELFRRLYDDWSTLDKFQRTRGVLRLLAKVIHRLWEGGDQSLVILPASIPMDDGQVKSELTRYLPDVWEPIISQDVDGDNSLPAEIDRATPTLGRVSACRRVTRTLYLGTAPGAQNKNPGIDDRRVRLGCAQPGEPAAVFGDALRRISDRAKYIHQDGNRYWISTKANLNRMAEDRASSLLREPETLHAEIRRRLLEQKQRGDFAGVHACADAPTDVPDEPEARLAILSPKHPHRKGQEESAAMTMAKALLASKGTGPRYERNCVVFLAADKKELDALMEATASYLAWKSISDEWERLNLDPFHKNQAQTKTTENNRTVDLRIAGSWIHALVPTQPEATSEVRWEEIKVSGDDPLAKRTSAKLKLEEMLMPEMGGVRLRMELDRYLWTDKDHVTVGQLAEWFARNLYLPRIKHRETLVQAIQEGLTRMDDTFAIAAGWDEAKKRYRGLRMPGSGGAAPMIDKATLVVKPAAAQRQLDGDKARQPSEPPGPGPIFGRNEGTGGQQTLPVSGPGGKPEVTPYAARPPQPPNLFIGSVRLDGMRIGRDAGRVAEEVIQHLSTLPGAEVEVTLEIRIRVPDGVKDDVVRTVTENANTLKFASKGFERE
jgi:hypothetical protein